MSSSGSSGGGTSLSDTVELVFCLDVRHDVVMLDKADDATNPPILHGTCTIDPNLGTVPHDPLEIAATMRTAAEHLKQRLEQSPLVSSFVYFEP